MIFVRSFESEWIKRKRSLASWLVIAGAFFTPLIIVIARLVYSDTLASVYASPSFWETHWRNSWESMAIFLLPIGIILATSLVVQIEYKNNAWKQLHTLPMSLTTIFFSKLSVVLVMVLQFFLLFNAGIWLSAIIPWLVIANVPYPPAPASYGFFLRENVFYLVDCLPIVAIQYMLSLKFRNFLVSIGTGLLMWILAIATLRWKFGFLVPYTFTMYNFLKHEPVSKAAMPEVNIHLVALGYFVLFTIAGYVLYVTKREKG